MDVIVVVESVDALPTSRSSNILETNGHGRELDIAP